MCFQAVAVNGSLADSFCAGIWFWIFTVFTHRSFATRDPMEGYDGHVVRTCYPTDVRVIALIIPDHGPHVFYVFTICSSLRFLQLLHQQHFVTAVNVYIVLASVVKGQTLHIFTPQFCDNLRPNISARYHDVCLLYTSPSPRD